MTSINDDPPQRERMLSWPMVREATGLSRATAWRRQRDGDFPQPVQLSPNRVAWRESEVLAWLASRTPRSQGAPQIRATRPAEAAVTLTPRPGPGAPEAAHHRAKPKRDREVSAAPQIAFDFGSF